MASFGQFTGNTIGEAAAFAAGLAIAPLLEPVLQELRNTTWAEAPTRPLDAATVAGGVAERKISPAAGRAEAGFTGISASAFDSLVTIMQHAPAVAEAIHLIRRGQLKPADFVTVLQRSGLEDEFVTAYQALTPEGLQPWQEPLPPAVAALAAVRGLIPDEGTLPVAPPTETGKVPAFPVYPLSGKAAAAAAGFTSDEYAVMVGINGRPMALHEAASAYYRGIIELADYYRAVSEGDTRNEWRDAILEQAREIATAHDAVENTLRGYSDQPTMFARAARHGMSEDDTTILFQNAGRPLPVHQITTALARGGTFNPEPGELTDPYEASVHESNIKPAYYGLAIANRYSYPSLFQLNALVKAKAISPDVAAEWATKDGLAPEVVTALHAFWQGEAGTTGKQLTPTQLREAYRAGTLTRDDALTRLEALGYSATDAGIFLGSPPTTTTTP